jgi:hypothetical protein
MVFSRDSSLCVSLAHGLARWPSVCDVLHNGATWHAREEALRALVGHGGPTRAVALARAAVRRRGASSPRKPPWRRRSLSAQTGDAVVVRGGL